MQIFVISLLSSTSRRAAFQKQADRLGLDVRFLDAVDGRRIANLRDEADHERFDFWPAMRQPGAIGCALSHREAYRTMLRENIPIAAILEDDAELAESFAEDLEAVGQLTKDGDIVLFHAQSDHPIPLDKSSARSIDRRSVGDVQSIPYLGSAVGYVLTAATATSLVERQTPLFTTADDWVQHRSMGTIDRIRLVYPFLVQQASVGSEIGYRSNFAVVNVAIWVLKRMPGTGPIIAALRKMLRKRRERVLWIDGV